MATVNTTWTSPASATLDKATGATIDETMTDAWSSDLYHLGGTAGYIGCRASHNTTQSIANSSASLLALNAESFDSDPNGAMHDTVTNNSRVVARTTGVYLVTCYVQWDTNATGLRAASLLHSSGTPYASDVRMAVTGASTDQTVATHALMTAGDYFEIQATQTSGGALNCSIAVLTVVKA
jgi:hypothetical protein